MELSTIEEMLSRRATLTEEEKAEVVKGIYENPEANEIACRGAIVTGNWGLFSHLTGSLAFQNFKNKAHE